jgi:hypothetical protein
LTAEIAGTDVELMLIRRAKIETLVLRPDLDD